MHHVVDAIRNTGLLHDAREQGRRGRRFFRRLHHNGVAARERRSHFPRKKQQRQIPRRDDSHYAQWLAHSVVQDGFSMERFDSGCLDQVGEHSEIGGRARNVEARCKSNRLTGIGDFGRHETIRTCFDRGGDPIKRGRAIANRHRSPLTVHGNAGSSHSLIDESAIGRAHLRDHAAIGGVHVVKGDSAAAFHTIDNARKALYVQQDG